MVHGASVRERLFRLIDAFNPSDLDQSLLLRARLITVYSAFVMFWIPFLAIGAGAFMSAPKTAVAMGMFGSCVGFSPFVMRRYGVAVGGFAAALSSFVVGLSASLLNGGPDLNTHMVLSLVPIAATTLSGNRAGVFWGVVVMATIGALYGAEWMGVTFPVDIPTQYWWLFQMLSAWALTSVLACFVMLNEKARQQATADLETREADLAAILDTAQDGLVVIGCNGHVERVNPAAEHLFGTAAPVMLGSCAAHLFPEGLELKHHGKRNDATALRADGSSFLADVTVGRLAKGIDERYVVIVRDVTERHETERAITEARDRAVQANRAKSSFLANMSHELRTPLNAILGYAELIAEEAEFGELDTIPGDAERIISSGRHLLALINDVLDLSKIEAGKLVLEQQPTDLDALLQTVVATVRPLVSGRGNALKTEFQPLGTVVSDPLRLKQVLLNLVSNASKFTERGVVTLRSCRTSSGTGDPDGIQIEVADTGIGMSPAQLDRIFEDFVQADSSTTRKYGGTGLGLAISRRIIQMMGGTITVWSEPGVGSTFTIDLPIRPVQAQSTPVPLHVRGGVLVIDEDPWTRGTLTRALRRGGLAVAIATSAEEGLRMAAKLQPRVVVLDVLRSQQSGWEILARLREDPATRNIPVAVLTMTTDRALALAMGATRLLEEPVDRARIVDVVRDLLPATAGHALVVEDDDDLREILTRTLAGAGWSVAEAADGTQGLAALAIRDPDVIVLDLMMPNMDGFEFVAHLQTHPTCRDVPILVVTARDLDAEEIDQLRGTVERVIRKGSHTRSELLNEVLGLVQRQRTPQELLTKQRRPDSEPPVL